MWIFLVFCSITLSAFRLSNCPVAVDIRQTLPFKGVHLLLGNDVAGDEVVVNPRVTDMLCIDQSPDPIEQELPHFNPSCAAPRAMSTKNQSDVDLPDSFIGQSFKKNLFLITCLNIRQTQMTVHQYRIIFLHLQLKKTMI